MNISQLRKTAHKAAQLHERLTIRCEDEAGSPGISRLRIRLEDAARARVKAENVLNAATEAMEG